MTSEPADATTAEIGTHPVWTVAAVARRLGVAPATLRTWDRRYGLGPTGHVAGAHRRYSPGDVERLLAVRALMQEGCSPAEAARMVLSTRGPSLTSANERNSVRIPAPATPFTVHPPFTPPPGVDGAGDDRLEDRARQRRRDLARRLSRAAMSLDTAELERLFAAGVHEHGVIAAWDELALPVLCAVGRRWEATGDAVDVEHALSEVVAGVLRRVAGAETGGRPPVLARADGGRVLLVCAEGDRHSLPLHGLAAALAERQVGVRLLGAGVPPSALVDAVRRTGPAVVFLFARLPVDRVDGVEALRRQRPAPRVVAGGPGWDGVRLPAAVARAGSLAAAVAEVTAALGH